MAGHQARHYHLVSEQSKESDHADLFQVSSQQAIFDPGEGQ